MADISALGNLQSAEPLDLELYPETKEFRLPAKGRYTVRAPEAFPDTAFGATREGFLSAQVDPTIVGPTNEGYTLRFTKISAKTWRDKDGVVNSQIGRYLRATGRKDTVSGDPQAQADAIAATANQTYDIDADWRLYCKGCGFQLEGMQNFPSDGNGGHSHIVSCPNCKDPESGEPVKLRGNLTVVRYIVK